MENFSRKQILFGSIVFKILCLFCIILASAASADLVFDLGWGYALRDVFAAIIVLCAAALIHSLSSMMLRLLGHIFRYK
jgi:type IV secretory pathway VirB2 component (pilin)